MSHPVTHLSALIQPIRRPDPQPNEASLRGDALDIERHDFVPSPVFIEDGAGCSLIFRQRRFDENDVKLRVHLSEFEVDQVRAEIHRRNVGLLNDVVLETNEFFELWVLFESVLESRVANKVLRSLTSVDEMLTIVVVGILGLRAL